LVRILPSVPNAILGAEKDTNMMQRLLLAVIFSLSAAAVGNADDISPCAAPNGVTAYHSVKRLPPWLAQTLKSEFGYLAEPGESFDATDVVTTGNPNRLIFAWNAGDAWLVARERGGIAYSDPIQKFTLAGGRVKLVAERSAIPNTVCSIAHAMMKGMP
jgi:hypothetical protein